MSDSSSCVINHLIAAMKEAFDPNSSNPPDGGGSEVVRLFAGEAIPLAAWNAHAAESRNNRGECGDPFLWVRLTRRFRTQTFPAQFVGPAPCGLPVVLALEVGVGRCAIVDLEPTWDDYANEAEISIDDSWRIELALCRALSKALEDECATNTAVEAIVPYGPEGGVIAWMGTAYVQL